MMNWDDELKDYDFDNDVLEFNPLFYNEPIHYLQVKWQRPLNDHEKHLVGMVYDWCRTQMEIEEIKMVEWLIKNERNIAKTD